MQKFAALILIVLLEIQFFYPIVIHTYFHANRKYIASKLCENIDRPQLQCKGKCYLKKQLKKAEEQEQKDQLRFNSIEPLVYTFSTQKTNNIIPIPPENRMYSQFSEDRNLAGFLSKPFHPPCI